MDINTLRNKLTAAAPRTTTIKTDSPLYPFWRLGPGQTATIRLLPNKNSDDLPFVEQRTVDLTFAGVVGGDLNTVKVTVPSLTMFGEKCPIVEQTRDYWKTNEDLARHFHYRRTFIYAALVVSSDMVEEGREPSVRIVQFSKPLHQKVLDFLMDPDAEYAPMDFAHGRDFRIKKVTKGQFANYDLSGFAGRERSLTVAEAALANSNWPALSDYLPAKVPAETLEALFKASFAGEPFDARAFPNLRYRIQQDAPLAMDYLPQEGQ